MQWHSNIKIHPQARHCLRVLVCVYFQGLRRYLLKNTRGHGYSWSVIDSCWHCTDRSVWLCENRPPCPPHKSHFHVSLNLLKLRVLGEWANEASASAQEKYVIGDCYGIYFGPLWLNYLNPAMFVCMNTIVFLSVLNQTWRVSAVALMAQFGRKGKIEWRIKILRTCLGTSGYDWQRKKGPVCSWNWQKGLTQPCTTQPNAFQKLPIWWWGKKIGPLLLTPSNFSWLLAKPCNPTAKSGTPFFSSP